MSGNWTEKYREKAKVKKSKLILLNGIIEDYTPEEYRSQETNDEIQVNNEKIMKKIKDRKSFCETINIDEDED